MNPPLPYSEEARFDTGTTNGVVGIGLFLASEFMFFGSLVAAYVLLRSSAPEWTLQLPNQTFEAWLATFLLLSASFLVSRAVRRGSSERSFFSHLLAAGGFAIGFLLLKTVNLYGLLKSGILPAASTANGLFYLFSVLHALHVLGGAAWILFLLGTGRSSTTTPGSQIRRGKLLLAYWAFLDVVWMAILALFYLG